MKIGVNAESKSNWFMIYRLKSSLKIATALAVLVGFSVGFSAPQSAQAFELFGVHLWGKKKDAAADVIGDAKYYTVDIVAATGAPEDSIKTVKASSSLVSDYKKPVSGSAGLLAKARGDYRKILAALYAQGRYGGIISIAINGQEAADTAFDTDLPEHSSIVITIDSGPEYKFSHASIEELAPPLTNKRKKSLTPKDAGYVENNVAKSGTILKAEQLAVDGWKQQGYAKASANKREVVADHADKTIESDIHIDPGMKARYGALSVKNVSKTPRMDSAYVAWMTGLKEGEQYNPDDLAKANKRLAKLQVFRAANVREAEKINSDGSLPLNLVLQERPLHRIGGGASYSTLDGAGVEAYWLHRNLFGHAESLRFDGKISGVGGNQGDSYNPKNFSYLLGTTFKRPGVITPDTDFIAGLKAQREVLDNYTNTSFSGQTGLTHTFNDQLSGRVYLNIAQTKSEDDYFGKRNFLTFGFMGGLLFDGRDNKTDTKHGVYAEATFEPVYEANYGNVIGKTTLEGRYYIPIDSKGRYVVATRAKVGSIIGADASQLPSDMLFFAGGGGSVRGYGYRNIGVKKETGDIIGGRSLVEGNAEFRAMVTDTIGAVAFVDAGVVGEDSYPDFSQQARVGAGLGLRYLTGLGPMRLDLAMPLNRQDGDPTLGFYIGIGQAF